MKLQCTQPSTFKYKVKQDSTTFIGINNTQECFFKAYEKLGNVTFQSSHS